MKPPTRRSPSVLTTLVAIAVLAAVVSACGSSDSSTSGESSSPTGSDSPASSRSDEEIIGGDATIASLRIEVTHPSTDPIVYEVGCWGDTFPVTPEVEGVDGAGGCERLTRDSVQSRVVDGPPPDQICTEQYGGPDRAHITGEIDGQPVDTTIDRADGCGIADWESLVPLLPPPLGVTDG